MFKLGIDANASIVFLRRSSIIYLLMLVQKVICRSIT